MRTTCILLAATLALGSRAMAQSTEELRAIERALPAGSRIAKELIVFTPTERVHIARAAQLTEGPRTLRVFTARDVRGPAGFAILAETPGKCQPITYLLVTDAEARIRAVEILAYRESHGGQVRDERWRTQFANKTPKDALRIGDDVRNIAGATISCRSITDAVRRDLHALVVARGELDRRAATTSLPIDASARIAPAPLSPPLALVRTRVLMGTTLTIETSGGDELALDAAFERVAELERALSDWDETSEVNRLALAATETWVEISEPLESVLRRALHWQAASGGAFDPCLGALTRLFRSSAEPTPPLELLASARTTHGLGALELEPRRARLTRKGTRIDLGAIGKGFALDQAAEELERRGVRSALLDFGGQILALDAPLGRDGWDVRLRDPAQPEETLGTYSARRISISTTADYERGRCVNGERVSHVLDPRTGLPVTGLLGVVVFDPSATDADALSTTLFVLGADAGERFARERGIEAWIFPVGSAPRKTPGSRREHAKGANLR